MNMKHACAFAAVIGLVSLAGCGKTAQDNGTSAPAAAPAAHTTAQPETQDLRNLAYYQAHLDEANDTWHKCLAMRPEAITEQVRIRCDMAHTAWSTQPYKPQPSTFSSSGGRH